MTLKHLEFGEQQQSENPEFFQPSFKNALSGMFWGCVGPNSVGKLVVCNGNINGKKYVSLLKKNLPDPVKMINGCKARPCIFQQDNALPHTAKTTKKFFPLHDINILPWPAQSSDLNIIENVRRLMKINLNSDERGGPKTKDELINRVQLIWNQLSRGYLSKFYASIPRRLAAIKTMLGYSTKY
eukprot:gene3544-2031_t